MVTMPVVLALVMGVPASAGSADDVDRFMGVRVMPGGVVAGDRIVYEGGSVVVVPAAGESFDSCPSGWVCLFANTNWQGAMVQFSSCCAWDNLSNFGFNNVASSWRNRKSVDAQIAIDVGGGGSKLCLNNNDFADSMPAGWDNVASSIRVRDAGTYC
jgi:Peptidase inhibitor family I36